MNNAQQEAFDNYTDEIQTFAMDNAYANRLFETVATIYGHPYDDTHNDKLIQLIRNDSEGYIVSLLDGLRISTRKHLEEALKHPVPFKEED